MPTLPTHFKLLEITDSLADAMHGLELGYTEEQIVEAWELYSAKLAEYEAFDWQPVLNAEWDYRIAFYQKRRDKVLNEYASVKPYSARKAYYEQQVPPLDKLIAHAQQRKRQKPVFPASPAVVSAYDRLSKSLFYTLYLECFYRRA